MISFVVAGVGAGVGGTVDVEGGDVGTTALVLTSFVVAGEKAGSKLKKGLCLESTSGIVKL